MTTEFKTEAQFFNHIRDLAERKKIQAIKEVRVLSGAGLKEAKQFVDFVHSWGKFPGGDILSTIRAKFSPASEAIQVVWTLTDPLGNLFQIHGISEQAVLAICAIMRNTDSFVRGA